MPPDSLQPRRILIVQLRRLGDVVLSTALLDDIASAFPEASVDFLVGPAAAPLLGGHPRISERIVFDGTRRAAMAREIRSRSYDWTVDVQGSLSTALLTRASRARVRLGWRKRGWRLWYTHARSRRGEGPLEYVVRERRRLLELAGVPVGDSLPGIHLSAEEREQGERDARASGAAVGAARVGLLLSTREPAKDWNADGFADVARALADEGVTPLVFRTGDDDARVERVRALVPGAVIVPQLDLRRFLGVLSTVSVFVSGDTGPAHMADALGVPRVTIFGPTPSEAWSPGLPTTVAVKGPGARFVRMRDREAAHAGGYDFTGGVTANMVIVPVRRLLADQGRLTPLATSSPSHEPSTDRS
jgi:ADP-heptose:LPS heptosyltransferase